MLQRNLAPDVAAMTVNRGKGSLMPGSPARDPVSTDPELCAKFSKIRVAQRADGASRSGRPEPHWQEEAMKVLLPGRGDIECRGASPETCRTFATIDDEDT